MADPQQQSPEDRLKAVREIGLSALSAIDRARNTVLDGQGERTLDAIARANAERVGDEAIDSTLRGELDTYAKLVAVADRAALLAAEIEAPLLPEGWTVRETIAARFYFYQGGNAQVSITKEADRGAMTIKVWGENTWTGYVGDAAGCVPLAVALTRAQETLADPSSHLSPSGVEKVEAAKNKLDAHRAEVVTGERIVIGEASPEAAMLLASWNENSGEVDMAQKYEQMNEAQREFVDRVVEEEMGDTGGYVVLTISNTDNAAFADVGRDQEVARIVREAADSIEGKASLRDVEFGLRDTNGNKVGKVEYTETVPTGEPDEGTVRLWVETGNSAFEGGATDEVARILREAADKVEDGGHNFVLRDYNGNTLGKFEFREEPSLDKDGVIDMNEALNSGRVYLAEDGFSGIADGEYRYVVTTPDFEPGYGQGEGDVWLVNAKGEIAPGYEEPQSVRETLFRELKRDEKSDLRAVAEGRVSFEDFERRFSGEEPGLG